MAATYTPLVSLSGAVSREDAAHRDRLWGCISQYAVHGNAEVPVLWARVTNRQKRRDIDVQALRSILHRLGALDDVEIVELWSVVVEN